MTQGTNRRVKVNETITPRLDEMYFMVVTRNDKVVHDDPPVSCSEDFRRRRNLNPLTDGVVEAAVKGTDTVGILVLARL